MGQQGMLHIGGIGLFWMLILAVLGAAAHLASNKALSYLSSPRVGIISMTEVLFGGIFGFMLFNEPLGCRSVIGGVLVFGSAICLNFRPDG